VLTVQQIGDKYIANYAFDETLGARDMNLCPLVAVYRLLLFLRTDAFNGWTERTAFQSRKKQ